MPVKAHEFPVFDPATVLENMLKHSPESYIAAERSSFFRVMYSAHDSRTVSPLNRDITADMWRVFFDTYHRELDSRLEDPAPGIALHKIRPSRVQTTHGAVVGAVNEIVDSVFAMFGLDEYEAAVRQGSVAAPMSAVLPPLYALRPPVEELLTLEPTIRTQVIGLLQDGFGIADAALWYTQVRSRQRAGRAYEEDRRRFAALRKLGVPAPEAVDFILLYPDMPVWQLVTAHRDGVPLEYMTEVF